MASCPSRTCFLRTFEMAHTRLHSCYSLRPGLLVVLWQPARPGLMWHQLFDVEHKATAHEAVTSVLLGVCTKPALRCKRRTTCTALSQA